jgi:hypothetical protein
MLDCGYRLDLVVEDQVIIESKSVSAIAQYMKHNYCLIYAFMVPVLEDCLLILM